MTTKIPTYVPRPMGTIDANSPKYLQTELASVSQSIKSIIAEIERINAVLIAHGIT
ncbi:hypothetical protein [Bradyrhizobium barranii]